MFFANFLIIFSIQWLNLLGMATNGSFLATSWPLTGA